MWIAWNLFVVCNYLNVGFLDRVSLFEKCFFPYHIIESNFLSILKYDPFVLNFNTDKKSWWYKNSVSCNSPIENRFEQLQFEKKFEKLKHVFTTSSASTPRNTSTIFEAITSSLSTQITKKSISNDLDKDEFLKKNCFFPFYAFEIMQAGVLIFLSVIGSNQFDQIMKYKTFFHF